MMFLFVSVGLQAQEKISPVTVTQKATSADGTQSVVKKRFEDPQALKAYLKELKTADGGTFEIQLSGDQTNVQEIEINAEDGHKMIYIRKNGAAIESNGQLQEMELRLHEKMEEMGQRMENMHFSPDFKVEFSNNQPMLGIYLDESAEVQGVKVQGLVPGGGAKAAGIQSGDIITGINGVNVQNRSDLRTALNQYKPGETIDVTYVRDGLTSTTESTLYRSRSSWERDPCEVFIGVSLGGNGPDGKGVSVSGIISDTPAEKFGLKAGDIITSFDGVFVNSFGELLRERNKHEPGDWFKVNVKRDGLMSEVTAQFKTCENIEEPILEEELVEEVKVVELESAPEVTKEDPIQPTLIINNTLELTDYQAFPNPTYGQFNLRFTAEALPTQVRVIDVNGKTLYNENLNNFDGFYNKQINLLKNAIPGTLFLQIIQGEKVSSQKIVLLPRA